MCFKIHFHSALTGLVLLCGEPSRWTYRQRQSRQDEGGAVGMGLSLAPFLHTPFLGMHVCFSIKLLSTEFMGRNALRTKQIAKQGKTAAKLRIIVFYFWLCLTLWMKIQEERCVREAALSTGFVYQSMQQLAFVCTYPVQLTWTYVCISIFFLSFFGVCFGCTCPCQSVYFCVVLVLASLFSFYESRVLLSYTSPFAQSASKVNTPVSLSSLSSV